MSRRYLLFFLSCFLVALFAFGIPIEHKYDKLFRFFSLTLIPKGVVLPPYFDNKIYFYISDLVALVLVFISLFLFRTPLSRFLFNKGSGFLWIVFFCAVISIVNSPLSSYPIPYIRLLQLLTPILLYSFLSHNFSFEENPKVAQIFITTLFVTACFESVITIAQYFNQAPLGLRILGEVSPNSFFTHINTNRWTLDYIFPRKSGSDVLIRASGTFPHSNVLGGFLCAALLSSYSLVEKFKSKIFFFFAFACQFFALSLTYSRSAFLSWILGTFVWLGLHIFYEGIRKTWKNPAIRFMTFSILLSLTLSTGLLYEQIFSRGGILNYSNSLAKGSDTIRLDYQDIALRMIRNKPITGVGYSQMTLRTPEYLTADEDPQKTISGTHNIYLFLCAETGIISLAAFLAFIGFLLRAAFQAPFTPQIASLLSIFIAFLFIGMCDFYPILFQQGKLLFFGFAGLLAAQSYHHKPLTLRENEHAISQ